MKINSREVLPNVLVLTFETNYELAMSFVRLQEFYESPKFQGKEFELEEYMDYWAEEFGDGAFDYPTRWSGFNIPGTVILDWMNKFRYENYSKRGIRKKEIALMEKILSRYSKKELKKCYIIGVAKGARKKKIVDHEVAHAMFTLKPKYKSACQRLFTKLHKTRMGRIVYERMVDRLTEMGYAQDVIEDEVQAYWSTSDTYAELRKEYKEIGDLKDLYKKFRKGNKK
jgi:hypothetical protein